MKMEVVTLLFLQTVFWFLLGFSILGLYELLGEIP